MWDRVVVHPLPNHCMLLGTFLTLVVMSCSAALEPAIACDADQLVAVSISSGASPVFSWAPACGVASLSVVTTVHDATSGWVLYSGARAVDNPLRSGIRYGVRPSAAVEPAPAAALMAGAIYEVTVSRWVGDASTGHLSIIGSGSFTAP